ncbi:hypothetical protein EXIGLDRAFT_835731 [Exidia glandulosa HHB12029]|uniref:Uncharacterized protein n=1 Tax=Exidia glandulosa HHB12029 TaxID=1314781 RepID=A0A165II38_EXIGL|nr:hypothetical protein EXIGLDRAFT_835731 [Exidia glandulosa HHB12029]
MPKTICEARIVLPSQHLPFIRIPKTVLEDILVSAEDSRISRYFGMFAMRLFGHATLGPDQMIMDVSVQDEREAEQSTRWTDSWPKPSGWDYDERRIFLFACRDPVTVADWFTPAIRMNAPDWLGDNAKMEEQYGRLFSKAEYSARPNTQQTMRKEIWARDRHCVVTNMREESGENLVRCAHIIPKVCGPKFILGAFAQAYDISTASPQGSWTPGPLMSPYAAPQFFGKFSLYNGFFLFSPLNAFGRSHHALLSTPNAWLSTSDVVQVPRPFDARDEEEEVHNPRYTSHLLNDHNMRDNNKRHPLDPEIQPMVTFPDAANPTPYNVVTGMDAMIRTSAGRDGIDSPVADGIVATSDSPTVLIPPTELVNTAYCATLIHFFRTAEMDDIIQCINRTVTDRTNARGDGHGAAAPDGSSGDGVDDDAFSKDSEHVNLPSQSEDDDPDYVPESDSSGGMTDYVAILALLCQLPLPSEGMSPNSSLGSAVGELSSLLKTPEDAQRGAFPIPKVLGPTPEWALPADSNVVVP